MLKCYVLLVISKIQSISVFSSLTNTGQKMVEWNQLDVSSFLDQVTGFLSEHGQLDGQSSQPPAKRARSVSVPFKILKVPENAFTHLFFTSFICLYRRV